MSRLIKKYRNRRLYDTELSRYIVMEDLHKYINDGVEFRVEDVKTGEDLTNATLLQIFVEMESGTFKFFSTEILRQLIRLANNPLNQSFKKVLEQLLAAVPSGYDDPVKDWQENTQLWLKQWEGVFKPKS